MPPNPGRLVDRQTPFVTVGTQNPLDGEAEVAGYVAAQLTAAGLAVATPGAAPAGAMSLGPLIGGSGPVESLRMVKSDAEIERIERAAATADGCRALSGVARDLLIV